MNTAVDFQGAELLPGDKVAFGTFGGMLDTGIVTGSESVGRTQLVVLDITRPDGAHETRKVHPAMIVKIEGVKQ
jgi:hypothetical protein